MKSGSSSFETERQVVESGAWIGAAVVFVLVALVFVALGYKASSWVQPSAVRATTWWGGR